MRNPKNSSSRVANSVGHPDNKSREPMGKAKKVLHNKRLAGIVPTPVETTPHPVDMTGVNAVVSTCECEKALTFTDVVARTSPKSLVIGVKTWMPVTCMICAHKMPYRTYDMEVTVEKIGLIVGACELKAVVKIAKLGYTLSQQSCKVLDDFCRIIRDTYKKAYAKRPKEIIRQVDQLLLELDRDTRLEGREVIRFNCVDGVASFSLMTATLVLRF